MDYRAVLADASQSLKELKGAVLEIITVNKPIDTQEALHLAKVVSKLSPLVGNMIEYRIVSYLNSQNEDPKIGRWIRQDPGFPDALFECDAIIKPGIEVKTWFPLATEITARFKDSVSHFKDDQTNVAMIAWLPEKVIYGRPVVLGVWVENAAYVAQARDVHYHNPPDYLVFEPEDTSDRTINLQQTNTNGYKFQGTKALLGEATEDYRKLGLDSMPYSHEKEYQDKIKTLLQRYPYRLDTNFAKMDRIDLKSLEEFKTEILNSTFHGKTVREWSRLISSKDLAEVEATVQLLLE